VPELRFHLAGLPVAVRATATGALDDLWPRYRAFPTAEPPLLTIDIERVAGFDRERGPEYPASRRTALADGRLHVARFDAEGEVTTGDLPLHASFRVGPSLNSLEACVRIAASLALPRTGALVLHASSVEHRGRALVFTGPSGAGKSTISSLLADAYPACRKLTDELTILRRAAPGRWEVSVPPFLSPAALPWGAAAPLASIHVLAQAPVDARDPLAVAEALPELLRQVLVYVGEPRTAALVLGLAADLVADVAIDRLRFRKDPAVGAVLGITPDATSSLTDTPAAPGPAVDARDRGRYPADLGQRAGVDPVTPEDIP
jgi:energy-coupling factor transporter ATP-binding protein EcfA2